jgi:acetylglutamate kinase
MEEVYVIKVGGNIIDNEAALARFIEAYADLAVNKILVHGGGKIATQIAESLGIETQMIEGRRVTDAETLKVVTMVYAGLINKNIVAGLQGAKCNAIGLCGADGDVLVSDKRPLKNGIDYGYVGDIRKVRPEFLQSCIENGLSPVVAPITHDGKGQLLNTNADTVAQAIAVGLASHYRVHLVYCFELPGVMRDIERADSVIHEIDPITFAALKADGTINKGMIPKLDNAFEAINRGVASVLIAQADDLTNIISKGERKGTRLAAS